MANNIKSIDPWTPGKNFSVPAHQELVDALNIQMALDVEDGADTIITPHGRGRIPPFDSTGGALVEAVPLSWVIPPEDATLKGAKLRKYMICKTIDGEKVVVEVCRHHVPYTLADWPTETKMYVSRPTAMKNSLMNVVQIQDTDESDADNPNPTYSVDMMEVHPSGLPLLYGRVSVEWDEENAKVITVSPTQENLTSNIGLPDEDVYLVAPDDSISDPEDPGFSTGDLIVYVVVERTASDGTNDPYHLRIGGVGGGGLRGSKFTVLTSGLETVTGREVGDSDPAHNVNIVTGRYHDVSEEIWAVLCDVGITGAAAWVELVSFPSPGSDDQYKPLQVLDNAGRIGIDFLRAR
jgi:hypothetical protein